MSKEIVTLGFRCGHKDEYLINHFIKYYNKLGVDNIVCCVGYWTNNYNNDKEKQIFDDFSSRIQKKYSNIIFHVLGEVESDGVQFRSLFNKIKELKQDYVIIADTDEFHEYPFDLQATIKFMIDNNYDYLNGATVERVSLDGSVINVDPDIDIFEQFPNNNCNLFIQPKISIIKNDYCEYVGVGHHRIDPKHKLVGHRCTKTHHFRWSEEGKNRAEILYNSYFSDKWKGWKSTDYATKRLEAFNQNLLTYPN